MKHRTILATLAVLGGLTAGLVGTKPAAAQEPVALFPRLPLVCSTTDYTEVAAKSLGLTAAELRVSLVSGKSLQDLASSKNVELQTVTDALNAARKVDVEQAVKDGLLSQQQADAINKLTENTPARRPRLMLAFGAQGLISDHNTVQPFVVIAKSIGISCADLIKALQQGQSISNLAESKNVSVGTVIDALVKAYKDALAQDVKEGLITQAQADGRSVNLTDRVLQLISRPMAGPSRGPFGGGFPFPDRPNRDGSDNKPSVPAKPNAAPTEVK